jgi:hypothetical protein
VRVDAITARRTTALLGVVVVLLLGLSVPAAVKAQNPPTGKSVALGINTRCPDRADLLTAVDRVRQSVAGRWVTVAGPNFGKRPGEPRDPLVAHAVDPRDPLRQYASDGRSIARTLDGGCSWVDVHFVPPASPSLTVNDTGFDDSILQLTTSRMASGPARVWALTGPRSEAVAPLRVIVSEDGGETWETRGAGLPLLHARAHTAVVGGRPGLDRPTAILATAVSDPQRAYLATTSTGEGDGPVYITTDGGVTWRRGGLTDATVTSPVGQISELTVDPGDADSVWLLGGDGTQLLHSPDGGTSWAGVDVSRGSDVSVDGLHVSRRGGSPHVQVVGRLNTDEFGTIFRSVNGADFVPVQLVEPMRGEIQVSQGGEPDSMVLSTDQPDQALILDLKAPGGAIFRSVAATGLGDVNAPQTDATAEPVHWFRRYEGLAAFIPGPIPGGPPPPPPKILPDRLFDPSAVGRRGGDRVPGTLEPAALEDILPPEGSREHDYTLDLPPLPTPVDVWFLMDTSGSMGGAIEGLQLGIDRIIQELKAAGMDAWFGLAEYKGENFRYARLADLAPPGPGLERGLRRLYASGGGEETQYTALYQTASGKGQTDVGIAPQQGASWRPEALRIVVHATDEPFGVVPDGPSRDEAVAAMNAAGAFHVGLDLSPGTRGVSTAPPTRTVKADLDDVARATGTFAPPEGVDCNGDGNLDLDAGQPLTCPIVRNQDEVEISQAIISAVRAVRDDTAVALTVVDGGGIKVDVADPLRVPVNVKIPNQLPFRVRFDCPAEMTGDVANIKLLATVRGAPSAPATARVVCGPPPVTAPAQIPGPLPPLVPFVASPPQLVPEVEPALTPLNQPSPGQVSAPSVQPGIAAQPGEVATAKQRASRAGPTDSSGDGDRSLPGGAAGTLAAGAALAVGMGGFAASQSRRAEKARQRR